MVVSFQMVCIYCCFSVLIMFSQFANVLNASLPHETQYSAVIKYAVFNWNHCWSPKQALQYQPVQIFLWNSVNVLWWQWQIYFCAIRWHHFFFLLHFLVIHKAKCKSTSSDAKPNRMHSCCNWQSPKHTCMGRMWTECVQSDITNTSHYCNVHTCIWM